MPYSWTTLRARVAKLTELREPDDPDLLDAKRDLLVARLELLANQSHELGHPITDEQRERVLAVLGRSNV